MPLEKQKLDELTDIFRTLFDAPALELRNELTAKDVEGWDSFNHINLVIAIEEHFNVRFTTEEIRGLRNVGDMKELLARKTQ